MSVYAGERCRAIDGDTLQCGRERVRIEGVHAPELDEPGNRITQIDLSPKSAP